MEYFKKSNGCIRRRISKYNNYTPLGIKYEDTGVFIIPQSKNIKKMDEEQKTKFNDYIQ